MAISSREVERVFYQDIKEKKKTGNGAHHKASKTNSKVSVHEQSDHLTAKEKKQLSSDVISYKDEPIDKIRFCKLSEDEQRSYIKFIIQKYNVLTPQLADMLGMPTQTVYYRLRKLDLTKYLNVKKKRLTKEEKNAWDAFIAKSKVGPITNSLSVKEEDLDWDTFDKDNTESDITSDKDANNTDIDSNLIIENEKPSNKHNESIDKFLTVDSIRLIGDNKMVLMNDITKVVNLMLPDDCKIEVSFKIIKE